MSKKNLGRSFVLIAALFLLLSLSACGGRYSLSGTWYADEAAGVRDYVFYESGKLVVAKAEYTYTAGGDGIVLVLDGKDYPAERTDEKLTFNKGAEKVTLFKRYNEAAASSEKKKAEIEKATSERLNGSWVSLDGKLSAKFEEKKLTMTALSAKGKAEMKNTYAVTFPAPQEISLSYGNEIVDRFHYEVTGDKLIFSNDETTVEYRRVKK